ncbi:UDP-N-acetylmuramate dehydrogenase [Paenibacillus chartarius]|uniref:UDP-N-acetylenolpyruvoylglucosamine reductase n=1 Tax=Paenibacillus chartarius TaxID=747481 RepID=A0ABV6DND1_9BACL
MSSVIAALQAASIGEIKLHEPLAAYTTWKIGGPADVLLIPETKEKLAETVRILHRFGEPWTVLGRGSNMLISDKGIRGFVLKLGPALDTLHIDGTTLVAGGAYSFIKLSVMAGKEGLTGLEFAGGIPGSVGGAVYMNAGAHGSDVSRILTRAELVLENGELATLNRDQLQYAYRHSVLHHDLKGIVTEAEFKLEHGDRKEIAAALAAYKDRRLRTQPLQLACAGSVFRNPEGHFAAKLIEDAGLKGFRIGGAEVSTLHANFIVNTGQATASDVLSLMEEVQRVVLEKFGVGLNPEVLVVGER